MNDIEHDPPNATIIQFFIVLFFIAIVAGLAPTNYQGITEDFHPLAPFVSIGVLIILCVHSSNKGEADEKV